VASAPQALAGPQHRGRRDDPGASWIQESGSCPFGLRLRGCETFPIFIDNDCSRWAASRRMTRRSPTAAPADVLDRWRTTCPARHRRSDPEMQNQEMQTVDALTGYTTTQKKSSR